MDPAADALAIHRLTVREEFPWDMRMAFNLAFNRSFAMPRVAALLASTGEVVARPRRRADDTGLIMYEILVNGFEHPRGRAALRRLNEVHRRFAIEADDNVYVLAALAVVPMRWLARYGWRRPCCHEREAAAVYYREVGRRMGVRGVPESYDAVAAWFDEYEARELRHTPEAERIERATRDLLRGRVPAPLRGPADSLIASLYDERLRRAYAVADPPAAARLGLHLALRARARLLRLAAPRRVPLFADGIRAKSYPDGYRIEELGVPD
jgi:hypothetical protein